MEVGVVPDIVTAQRADHVAASARFQHARLFSNHFERGAHAEIFEVRRNAQRRIVGRGLDVVLGIEPEHDVDGAFRGKRGRGDQERENQF